VTGGITPLDYAAWRESTLGRVTERLERAVVLELAGPRRGIDVLDVGAGDGAYALPLAKGGARLTALDRSLPALRVLDRRARDSGSRLVVVAADAQALPFEAGTFDLAIAAAALAPLDPLLGRATTVGAAFVALEAQKPASRRAV
jgi:ubiquinone/menaquinone biosynthesis C-methylase UbiE